MVTFTLNGEKKTLDVDPEMPLLWALRDHAGLTGTKFGCGLAQCGACTVHVDGIATRSCQTPVGQVEGASITTIEGATDRVATAVRDAWIALDVPQCGYCQSGQIMSAVALLAETPKPTDEDIDTAMAGNLCRCATYQRIRATSMGFAVGFRPLASAAAGEGATGQAAPAPSPFDAYLAIAEDGSITVLSSQFDMGQGSYHGIATLVAEELDASLDDVTVVGAAGNTALYGNLAWGGVAQGTGGSTSMTSSWDRYRQAGAAARHMLVAAAAKAWGVPAADITIADGRLTHAASGRESGFGAFAKVAASQPVPAAPRVKTPQEWRLIGNAAVKRFDARGKTDGSQAFTIDVALPGLLTAVMIHPPRFGATVASFDAAKAKALPGVVDVVEIPRGIAVVAKDMWSALKGRDAVSVTWDESKAEKRGTPELLGQYKEHLKAPPQGFARDDGDATGMLRGAERVIEAEFEFPFLAHAAIEPLNAVARRAEDGTVEVWGGHQMPDIYRGLVAKTADVPVDKVRLHVMKAGGSFGRRAVSDGDVVVEATAIAKAMGWSAPVKVQWTRENDMRGGRYRPAYVHRLRAALGPDGLPVAWDHHIVGQSILAGSAFAAMMQNGIDPTSVEGASNLPYAIPNLRVGLTTPEVGIPVLWWRSVGSTHTAYATEVFIDELAEAAGIDPVDYRLALLKDHPAHAGVLRLAAEKAGWSTPLPEGRARGVAVHESFSSHVAEIAEVSVADGRVTVHKVVAAVDVGTPINPDTIRAQVEGGVGFGLGAIFEEELTLKDGVAEQENYDTYLPLRLDRMPEVEVHIVPSTAAPTGIGEPGVPPIGPAVANAVARLTGKRVRILPFSKGLEV